jgi:hypothetical protein
MDHAAAERLGIVCTPDEEFGAGIGVLGAGAREKICSSLVRVLSKFYFRNRLHTFTMPRL